MYGNGAGVVPYFNDNGRFFAESIYNAVDVTGEVATLSPAGRMTDQSLWPNGTQIDANPSGDNYTYDGAGRLLTASLPGVTYNYGYSTSPGCTEPNAAQNTNRATVTVTGAGAGATSYCYNKADQLESMTGVAAAQIVYDDHRNTTQLGADSYDYDAAGSRIRTRHLTA